MNKRQLVVAWLIGIWISVLFVIFDDLAEAFRFSIPIVTIGSLLVYTLKDEK